MAEEGEYIVFLHTHTHRHYQLEIKMRADAWDNRIRQQSYTWFYLIFIIYFISGCDERFKESSFEAPLYKHSLFSSASDGAPLWQLDRNEFSFLFAFVKRKGNTAGNIKSIR